MTLIDVPVISLPGQAPTQPGPASAQPEKATARSDQGSAGADELAATSEAAAVVKLDLGPLGIAIDLTDVDWPGQLDCALTELEPLLTSSDSAEVDLERVGAFVDARTAELVDNGAVSLILLPTGSVVAPLAVGAIFVDAAQAGPTEWAAALEGEGWTVTLPGAVASPQVPRVVAGAVPGVGRMQCSRRTSIPGIAGVVLSEHLLVLDAGSGVLTVVFQGASAQTLEDLSDSVIMKILSSVILEKG